jgi:hypothetical protein
VSNRQGWATTGVEAVRTAWAMRSRRWWTRKPRVPLPDRTYLKWRSYTAYGDPNASMVAADVASFLSWRTGFRRYVRRIR